MKMRSVIGDPIAHSLSDVLHKELYGQLDIQAKYSKKHIKEIDLESFALKNKAHEYNVTIPHKEKIIKSLDALDSSALSVGAVNCVKDNKGYNTDWLGFKSCVEYNNIITEGRSCLILGAGGAAKAVAYALIKLGVESIKIKNRSREPKAALEQWIYNQGIKTTGKREYNIIINCTPIGMWPKVNESPYDLDKVLKSQIFIDTIYNPYETKLIRYCKKNASKAIGGVDMFIFQAIESLKIWEEDVIDMDIDINKIKKVLKSKLC